MFKQFLNFSLLLAILFGVVLRLDNVVFGYTYSSAATYTPTNYTSAATYTPTNYTSAATYTPTNYTSAATYTPTNYTSAATYTPTNYTSAATYTPTNYTSAATYTPTNYTSAATYTPTYSTNTSSYDYLYSSYVEEDWLSCGYSGCGSSYTYTPIYTYTPTTSCSSSCCGSSCYTPPTCSDQCSVNGMHQCSGNGYQVCGNYDSDSCLEWGGVNYCGANQVCNNGSCLTHETCSDQCFVTGQRQCSGNGFKQCGNYDSDSCLEWGSVNYCDTNEVCNNGSCSAGCSNECTINNQRVCSGNGYKQCGNYDSDSCLEWGTVTSCGANETCVNGSCEYRETCTNECTVNGQRVCSGNGYKQCGNYDSDSCLEWGTVTSCGWNQTCTNGSCGDTCQNECTFGQYQCSGSSARVCGNGNDNCTAWGNYLACDSRCQRCGDSRCECGETQSSCPQDCGYNTPTVDLRTSGTASCNQSATLTWTSSNAASCAASGSWSGGKSTSGSETVGNFTGSRTYTITCTGSGGAASDTVTLNGSDDTLEVNAGSDQELDADENSLRLNGSVDGDYDSLAWSCTGGSLSDSDILRPTWKAPFSYNYDYNYNYDRDYTCTLTARNECGSDSDTMRISVDRPAASEFSVALIARPKADCAPLDNVDLVATVSNYNNYSSDYGYNYGYNREFTYSFDCENDGIWDKTVTVNDTAYTALDLCDYRNVGSYTAKVRVTRDGRTATDTEIVRADACGTPIVYNGRVSITKSVRNTTRGISYLSSVAANPLDIVGYKIIVTGVSGNAANVRVSDAMPSGITNVRDLQVDGYASNGDLRTGIDIGSLTAGQTKIITYTATVANESSFAWGQTTLNNVAMVYAGSDSATSNASVTVLRRAVQGATTVSTGFDAGDYAGLGIALAGAIACLIWVLALGKPRRKAGELAAKIGWVKRNDLAG